MIKEGIHRIILITCNPFSIKNGNDSFASSFPPGKKMRIVHGDILDCTLEDGYVTLLLCSDERPAGGIQDKLLRKYSVDPWKEEYAARRFPGNAIMIGWVICVFVRSHSQDKTTKDDRLKFFLNALNKMHELQEKGTPLDFQPSHREILLRRIGRTKMHGGFLMPWNPRKLPWTDWEDYLQIIRMIFARNPLLEESFTIFVHGRASAALSIGNALGIVYYPIGRGDFEVMLITKARREDFEEMSDKAWITLQTRKSPWV